MVFQRWFISNCRLQIHCIHVLIHATFTGGGAEQQLKGRVGKCSVSILARAHRVSIPLPFEHGGVSGVEIL